MAHYISGNIVSIPEKCNIAVITNNDEFKVTWYTEKEIILTSPSTWTRKKDTFCDFGTRDIKSSLIYAEQVHDGDSFAKFMGWGLVSRLLFGIQGMFAVLILTMLLQVDTKIVACKLRDRSKCVLKVSSKEYERLLAYVTINAACDEQLEEED